MMLYLDFSSSLFLLSQTSSAIWFGDRNLALSRTDIADYWLRNEYLARPIISQLEQVVILFQLFYGWTIYSPMCLFLYIKLRLN